MIVKSRLHLYPSKDVKERAYIIGDRAALLSLAEALKKAATGAFGSEILTVYADNGHDYDVFITKNVEETEWQNMPADPCQLESIKIYDDIKSELQKERTN
jgi:hypothetical protein